MRHRLLLLWDRVHTSYWSLPAAMLVAAAAAAHGLTLYDEWVHDHGGAALKGLFVGTPEGARAVLLAIATSVLGVAGTTFTITIAVLSLTSSQFGPRLLRLFLKDTGSQVVLGTFVGTFLYTLLVLRTVRGVDESPFVPHTAAAGSLVLAIVSVAMLLYFIQHVVRSIQAGEVIAAAGQDLLEAVDRLYPEEPGGGSRAPAREAAARPGERRRLTARRTGYLEGVDMAALVAAAARRDIHIALAKRPGRFVARGDEIAMVAGKVADEEELAGAIDAALTLGKQPTEVQDIGFAFDQLSDIAVRALSSGVNDPGIARMCVEWLGAGLAELAGRPRPETGFRDDEGVLRATLPRPGFGELLDIAFDQVRRYGARDAEVMLAMMDALARTAPHAGAGERSELARHLELLVLANAGSGCADEAAAVVREAAARLRPTLTR